MGPTGFIPDWQRTQEQHDADADAKSMMPVFNLPVPQLAKGESVRLTRSWKAPEVVAEIGFEFNRFHQLTGSCVGTGGGNALATLIFIQRLLQTNPTKAFIPWWPFNYGRSRFYAGMKTRGEGSFGSTFYKSLIQDGVIADTEQGLPKFTRGDGLLLTRNLELDWSDGDTQLVMQYMNAAKEHPIGATGQIRNVGQVRASIVNGYPCTIACNNAITRASIQGSGEEACVMGYWDSYAPHQQSIHDYWEHSNFGPIYYVMNNWPGSTYPRDPAGGPTCGCWVKEKNVEAAMRLSGEVFALSNLAWFPAVPEILNYFA